MGSTERMLPYFRHSSDSIYHLISFTFQKINQNCIKFNTDRRNYIVNDLHNMESIYIIFNFNRTENRGLTMKPFTSGESITTEKIK